MTTATIPTSTTRWDLVRLCADTLRDIFRTARSRATSMQDDEYARNAAKKCISTERSRALEFVTALVVDLGRRCQHAEDAEAPGLYLAAVGRNAWADAHPNHHSPQLSRDEARIAEQIAQGESENAEKAYDIDPSTSNAHRLLAASAKYVDAVRARDEAVRRHLAKRA